MSDATNPPPSGGYGSPPPPPPGGGYGGGSQPPPNHLVWAILSTIFCCLPLGVVSIVFAAQVNGKHASGDIAGAQEASRKARSFALWSTIIGAVVIVLYIVGLVAFGLSFSGSTEVSTY